MQQFPVFIKVGNRVINPWLIALVNLNYLDDLSGKNSVIVSFFDGDYEIFHDSEADILRAYFLHGSRSIDLNNHETTTQGGTK